MTLCEYAFDLAGEEAKKRLEKELPQLIDQIAQEIVSTAEEYEPETTN